LFVYSGGTAFNDSNLKTDFFKCDTTTNSGAGTWSNPAGATLPPVRIFGACCSNGNNLVIYGGYPNGGLDTTALDDLWTGDYTAGTITNVKQAGGTVTVNASSFTKDGWQWATSILSGKAILTLTMNSTITRGEYHMWSKITLVTT
jgi:hypothetical protein